MSHHPVTTHRTRRVVLAAVAACAVPLVSTGAATAADTARIGAGNDALVSRLQAAGGTVSADGRWVALPGGVRVSLVPAAYSDCPSGSVCLWESASYTGRMVSRSGAGASIPNLGTLGFDNTMTSWANRSNYDARWFYDVNLGGTTRCMNSLTSLSNIGATDNDEASSLKIYSDTVACS